VSTLTELRAQERPVAIDSPIRGYMTPRLWTRPLAAPGHQDGSPWIDACGCGTGCGLYPATSLGFQAIAFAEHVLGQTLLPWQRFWLVHALELRPDGNFRFRTILTLVSRQNGKTFLLKVLALWAMYLGHARLVLGAAQSLDIARESWQGAVDLTQESPELGAEIGNVRYANGEQCITLLSGARYRIAAATRSAGRGLSVDLLILDELREHRTPEAWAALSKTTMARPNALTVCISNAGDDQSVVLNQLRQAAMGETNETLGLFEWSAPDGCALDDPEAIAQACPGLGWGTITMAAILNSLATDPPAVFRTELLCQHVPALDSAIDPAAWGACADALGAASLAAERDRGARIALCCDVSLDGQHVTLYGAALLPDGRVRLFPVGSWGSIDEARDVIPPLVEEIAPSEFGWFPNGPGAALAPEFRTLRLKFRRTLAEVKKGPDGIRRVITDDEEEFARLSAGLEKEACQTFAADVLGRRVIHPDDPLLNAHVHAATKVRTGDSWRFGRTDAGHVDAAYAAAGALYLARMIPKPEPVPRSKVF
jgi:hypothetical protein